MRIAVGSDPNASMMKREVIDELKRLGHEVQDFGSDDPIYANVVFEVGESVVRGDHDRGIVLCGTGIGASIAANKVPGVFCALVTDTYQAERAALSNNTNVIALGQQITGTVTARCMVNTWITNTEKFDAQGRSASKVRRISEYEEEHHR